MRAKAYFFLGYNGGTISIGTMHTSPPDATIEEFRKRAVQVGRDLARHHRSSSLGTLIVRIKTLDEKGKQIDIETTMYDLC